MSWTNSKLELRKSLNGFGLFTTLPIKKDERLIWWGGRVSTLEQLQQLPPNELHYFLQLDDDIFQTACVHGIRELADYTNHSCDPNAGFGGHATLLVAMRDIIPDEEILFDYAMSETTDSTFICECGTNKCRKQITGQDYLLPFLQEKYKNYFSPYILKKLKK